MRRRDRDASQFRYFAGLMMVYELSNRVLPLRWMRFIAPCRSTSLCGGSQHTASFTVVLGNVAGAVARYRSFGPAKSPFAGWGRPFRVTANSNGYNPSLVSVTAGAGLAIRWHFVRIEPTARYTRWQADLNDRANLLTNHNQAELLVGFSF